ncbi:hotdog fold domain-containing protein [Nocardioides sp. AE5]|uniref:PaaI family thioesterase n=1 Tax=Nocardioides sp. AE5 TaxID=2962573 RepID=UPI002880D0B3|nr:hotdog fold domain-containing protein [Nocardioides sp. AE5]MDT0202731.1 hotdog fold domain-containing protein [Nocardioides sp. AE5]
MTGPDVTDIRRGIDVVDDATAELTDAARRFQDTLRGHRLAPERARAVAVELDRLTAELEAAGAADQLGEMDLRPGWKGTGQTMVPHYEVLSSEDSTMHGTITFSRFHLGAGIAVHGGALALWVDDILGRLAHGVSEHLTRTANLHIEFRRLVPVGQPMEFTARVASRDGRKRRLRVALGHGGETAVEAEGLWIETRPPSA